MISAIEWIPAGRADPTPSKYEYSRAEREFLARVQAHAAAEAEAGDGGASGGGDDDSWEDVDDNCGGGSDGDGATAEKEKGGRVVVPKVDVSSLPADLNMDDYSDDDDDGGGRGVGDLLVGKDAEMQMAVVGDDGRLDGGDGDGSDDDTDDEDDLADVPDTREYMPLDVEGLQAVGIGGSGGGKPRGGGYTMEDLRSMTMNGEVLDGDGVDDYDDEDEDEDDEEDADDIKLHDGDALLVVAKTEEDFASLEVNVFESGSSNLYVHHDIPLPSFPLCLALGSVVSSYRSPGGDGGDDDANGGSCATSGNYVAVGSFEPGIEVWNLDVMNALEPTVVLGGMDTRGAEEEWMRMQMPASGGESANGGGRGKKKKKKNSQSAGGGGGGGGLREGSHTDAVMGLSWNTVHANVLASGSADSTVKLWDVTQSTGDYVRPSSTLTHHADKVQSLAWHPSEGTLLATGGYDRRVCLVDARSADGKSVKRAKLSADCEAIAWDPHGPQYLTAASEDGVVQCWDVRKFGSEPVWSMVAHEYGVSDICYNSVPGMLITCSIDKTVALWDTNSIQNNKPHQCGSKDMNVGKLYSVSCYPSTPWLLACGGGGNELAIWDFQGEDAIQKRFKNRVNGGEGETGTNAESEEPDFEAAMAIGDDSATRKAIKGIERSKKKKVKKKNKKVHKKR